METGFSERTPAEYFRTMLCNIPTRDTYVRIIGTENVKVPRSPLSHYCRCIHQADKNRPRGENSKKEKKKKQKKKKKKKQRRQKCGPVEPCP